MYTACSVKGEIDGVYYVVSLKCHMFSLYIVLLVISSYILDRVMCNDEISLYKMAVFRNAFISGPSVAFTILEFI